MSSQPESQSDVDGEPHSDDPKVRSYTGESVNRIEDEQILTGREEYIHDRNPADSLEMVLVRSVRAHAEIVSIDTSEAEDHPNCVGVFTASDLREECHPMPAPLDTFEEYPLANGRVRFVGEPIAAVVVDGDRYVGEDVADLVDVDYDPLEPVIDPIEAREDRTVLHQQAGTNVAASESFEFGPVEEQFEKSDRVITGEYNWGRISGVPLETAGVIAEYDRTEDAFRIESNVQLHTLVNESVCETLGYPKDRVDMHVPKHVGGSFGNKIGSVTRYCCLAAIASKILNRPVRFNEDRIENLQGGDAHSTDREYEVRLALDEDGTFRAIDIWFVDDMGAYPRYAINQMLKPLSMFSGVYRIPAVRYSCEAILTNKTTQAPYRGFGIQPQNYVLEAIVDKAARKVGIDATRLRRKNMISPESMPYTLPTENVYDSGDYIAALNRVEELLEPEYDGGLLDPDVIESRRQEGKYRGVQPAVFVEPGVVQSDWRDRLAYNGEYDERTLADVTDIPEHVRASIDDDGTVTVFLATDSAGQGHQTIVTQLVADELGIHPSDVTVDYLGSAEAPTDYGSAGSRLAVMLAGAIPEITDRLTEQLETFAADQWDCSPTAVEYRNGSVHTKTGTERLDLDSIADRQHERERPSIEASYSYPHPALERDEYEGALLRKLPSYATASFAANAAIVEVDIETGEVEILRFYSVRDCGTQLNPEIVEGQEIGGVVQGVGAALLEEFAYDESSGQPQSITLFDYLLPAIGTVPEMTIEHTETPSPFTELGAKGVGESGITDAPASIASAISDALSPFEIDVGSVPFTPNDVRNSIRNETETAPANRGGNE